ncbi:MAG: 3-oxoacyl-[acyl-carrier-protein] reductase [Alphaproteobacteria bacterium]|nr:3-oxoacyl-[acyl-carrier-protein] reductase [Alphaproteobacteria bacterium]
MFDLTGRVALVTGASGGLGGAIARTLHRQGATVVLTGRKRAALDALAAELGGKSTVFAGDLADPAMGDALVKGAEAAFGSLDILVNNAGLTRDTLLLRMKDEDWQTVIDVDLTAAFRLTRTALRGMLKRRWGRVVTITSVVGATGNPGQANYAAAKAGLVGMSKAVAAEVAERGVTVNCVAPGFIATAMTDALNEAQRSAIQARIPAGRLGTPTDVAACVLFLASQEAAYVTGQTVHVNGGMAMI